MENPMARMMKQAPKANESRTQERSNLSEKMNRHQMDRDFEFAKMVAVKQAKGFGFLTKE